MDIVSILQTSVEKDEDTNIYNNGSKESYRQPLHFLICDSCFWCASCIRLDALDVKCPSCNGNKVNGCQSMMAKFIKFIIIVKT